MTDYKDRVSGWATDIDWSEAPDWAGAVISGDRGSRYWVVEWGIKSVRQRLGMTKIDNLKADMTSPNSSWSLCATRPASPWSGDGLPPVGARCEVLNNDLSNAEWEQCTILFSGKHRIVYDSESCSERVGYRDCLQFRPIKTPAQIAADEREAAIGRMRECFDSVSDDLFPTSNQYLETLFGALHDAGYRLTKGDDK